MAERREKCRSILLRFPGKTRIFELYSAEQWPGQNEADVGLFRVCECEYVEKKKKQRWISLGGQKYTFFTLEAIMQVLLKELAEPGALEALERPRPKLRKGQWVRWYQSEHTANSIQTKLVSDPICWVDGQWYAALSDYKHGVRLVRCDEMMALDNFGREVPA